jgi:hypothetical protein
MAYDLSDFEVADASPKAVKSPVSKSPQDLSDFEVVEPKKDDLSDFEVAPPAAQPKQDGSIVLPSPKDAAQRLTEGTAYADEAASPYQRGTKLPVPDLQAPFFPIPRVSTQQVGGAMDAINRLGISGIVAGMSTVEALRSVAPKTTAVAGKAGTDLLADTAEFFESPMGISTLGIGELPKGAQKLIGLGFAAQAIAHSPETVTRLVKAKTDDERAKALASLLEELGVGVAGVTHGLPERGAKPPPLPTDTRQPIADTSWRGGESTTAIESVLPKLTGDVQERARSILAKQAAGTPLSTDERATLIQLSSFAAKDAAARAETSAFTGPTEPQPSTTAPAAPESPAGTAPTPAVAGGRSSLFEQAKRESVAAQAVEPLLESADAAKDVPGAQLTANAATQAAAELQAKASSPPPVETQAQGQVEPPIEAAKGQPIAGAPHTEAAAVKPPQKTRLDQYVEAIQKTGREMTIEVEDATPESLRKIIKAAEDKGVDASTDGRFVLLRPKSPTASVKPAIQLPSGEVFTGDDHVSAYAKAKETTPDTSGSKEGFVDAKGNFISREQAAQQTGLPTATEPGKLHSSDLPDETSTAPEPQPAAPKVETPPEPVQQLPVETAGPPEAAPRPNPPLDTEYVGSLEGLFAEEEAPPQKRAFSVKRGVADPHFAADPLVQHIENQGGLLSKSAAKAKWGKEKWASDKGVWDDAPAKFAHPSHNRIYKENGLTPDEMAQTMVDAGLLKEGSTAPDMWRELKQRSESANRMRQQEAAQTRDFKALEKQQKDFSQEAAKAKGGTPINPTELKPGDKVKVGEEELRVTHVDEDGNVTLEDGKRYGVQQIGEDDILYGELTPGAETEPIFIDPKELKEAADWSKITNEQEAISHAEQHELFTEEAEPSAAASPQDARAGQADAEGQGGAGAAERGSEVAPKLRPGEKGTAELFQGADQPFNLAGETAIDFQRIADEKAAAERVAAEAKAKQDREQLDIFAEKPKGEPAVDQKVVDRELADLNLARTREEAVDHLSGIEDENVLKAVAEKFGVDTDAPDLDTLREGIADVFMDEQKAKEQGAENIDEMAEPEEETFGPPKKELFGGGTMTRRISGESEYTGMRRGGRESGAIINPAEGAAFVANVGKAAGREALRILRESGLEDALIYLRANVKDLDEELAKRVLAPAIVPTAEGGEKASTPPQTATQPELPGVPPAEDGDTTALKRAVVDTQARAEGRQTVPTETRPKDEVLVKEAEESIKADPTLAPRLVSEIVDEGKSGITEKDAAALLVERNRMGIERRKWQEIAGSETSSDTARAQARGKLQELEAQQFRLDQASRAAGREWSDVGRMYQRNIREDYSLEALEWKERAARGRPLNEAERDIIAKQAEELKAANERAEKAEAEAAKVSALQERNRIHEATIKDLQREAAKAPKLSEPLLEKARSLLATYKAEADEAHARLSKFFGSESGGVGGVGGGKGGGRKLGEYTPAEQSAIADIAKVVRYHIADIGLKSAEVLARVVDKFGTGVDPYFETAWKMARKLPDKIKVPKEVKDAVERGVGKKEKTLADVSARAAAEAKTGVLTSKTAYEAVRAVMASGVRGEMEVVNAALELLKPHFPDLTVDELDVKSTRYGQAKYPNQAELEKSIRKQMELRRRQAAIEDVKRRGETMKSGPQRDKMDADVRKRESELKAAIEQYGKEKPTTPEELANREATAIRAKQNAIEDLNRELVTGEKKLAAAKKAQSPQVEQLQAELDAMREFKRELDDAAKPKQTPEEIEADKAQQGVDKAAAALDRWDRIMKGEIEPEKKATLGPRSNLEEELRAQTDALKRAKREMETAAKRPTPEQAEADKAQKAVDRAAAALDRQERINKGEIKPEKAEKKQPLSTLEKELRDRTEELRKAKRAAEAKSPEQRYNEAQAKNIERQSKEAKRRLAEGDYSRPQKRVPPKLNKENMDAKEALQALKDKIDTRRKQIEWDNRPPMERRYDQLTGINRFGKLTRIKTLGKLMAMSVQKLASTAVHEATSGVMAKTTGYRELSQRANVEGGFSGEALKKFYSGFFTEGMRDAAKTGSPALNIVTRGKIGDIHARNPLKTLYGPKEGLEKRWYDIPQIIHEMEKSPLLRASFEMSAEKLFEHAKSEGRDITTPEVQGDLLEQAYRAAERDILMNPNAFANMVNRGIAALEEPNKQTGKVTLRGKTGAFALRTAATFVRVATNHFVQTFNATTGLISGHVRYAHARGLIPSPSTLISSEARAAYSRGLAKGLSDLHPEDANSIVRQLKHGVPGAALVTLGIVAPQLFGGLDPHKKRKEGEPRFGEMKVGGVTIPRWVVFATPWLIAGQISATMMQTGESFRRKHDVEPRGKLEGALAATAALAQTGPLVNEGARFSKLFDNNQRAQFFGDWLQSNAIPGILTEAAEAGDKDANGDIIRRDPQSFIDHLKMNVPILRKEVPEKTEGLSTPSMRPMIGRPRRQRALPS